MRDAMTDKDCKQQHAGAGIVGVVIAAGARVVIVAVVVVH